MGWSGVAVLLLSFASACRSYDANWGKRVECFRIAGTVICPGCNQRAGLACPRALKNSPPCDDLSTTTIYLPAFTKRSTTTVEEELKATDPTVTQFNETIEEEDYNSTTTITTTTPTTTREDTKFVLRSPKDPSDLPLYYYQQNRIAKRDTFFMAEGTCGWNGDCPCPLICCKTGTGCPKRCVAGIRLPPPFG